MDIEKLKNSAKKDSLLECFLSKGPVEEISSGSSRDVGLEKGLGAASVDFYEACMRSKKAELAREFLAVGGIESYQSGKGNGKTERDHLRDALIATGKQR